MTTTHTVRSLAAGGPRWPWSQPSLLGSAGTQLLTVGGGRAAHPGVPCPVRLAAHFRSAAGGQGRMTPDPGSRWPTPCPTPTGQSSLTGPWRAHGCQAQLPTAPHSGPVPGSLL